LVCPLVEHLPAQLLLTNIREDLKPFGVFDNTSIGTGTAPAAELSFRIDHVEIALGDELGASSVDTGQN
jgi:hypothetical protein